MSVNTAADDKRDEAREHVSSAVQLLSEIVVEKCWGYDDFTTEYQKTLRKSLNNLIEVREEL
jgi:hypothetical protein